MVEMETDALWDKYRQTGDRGAKDEIIKRFLPLVRYVASRLAVKFPVGLDFEDILSFGVLGLLDAFDRFEPNRGFTFQTFAVPRIRGAVLDELRKFDWISRSGREKLQKFERTLETMTKSRDTTDDASLMKAMNMDERSYRELLDIASRSYVVSLDDVMAIGDGGDVQREDFVEDEAPSALDIIEQEEEAQQVAAALGRLPEREKLLLSLYYYENLTLKEIGKVMGVSESRVSQLHGRALSLLKAELKVLL
ncbi:RNA polymerase sigma factor [Synergistales bacterium]|nr:RNA polymerase sigma factor [Synergistales bacterium]